MKRARTMNRLLAIGLAMLGGIFQPGTVVAEEPVVSALKVVIPFSAPTGWPPAADMVFHVPAGTYYITLQVDRASWDHPGIADAVPVGLGAYGRDAGGRRGVYNRRPWHTGLGFVTTEIYIAENSSLHVVFSTLAPAGARGILNIVRRH